MDSSDEEEQQHRTEGPANDEYAPCNDTLSPGASVQRAERNENGQLHQKPAQMQPLDLSHKRSTQLSASASVGEFGNPRVRCAIPAPCIPQYNNDLRRTPGPSWMATEAASPLQPSTPLQALNYTNGLSGAGTNFVARVPNTPLMTARSPQTDRLYDSAAASPALVRPRLSQQPAFPGLEPPALRSSPPSNGPMNTAGKHVPHFNQYPTAAATAPVAWSQVEDEAEYKAFRDKCVREGIPNSSRNGRKQNRNRRLKTGAAAADSEHCTKSSSPPARKDSGKNRSNGEVDGDCAPQGQSNSSGETTTNNGDASAHVPDTEDPKNGARNDGGDSPSDGGVASAAGPMRNGRRHGRSPDDEKDKAYWERRSKNNEAAKKSRDARRAREQDNAIMVAYLKQENAKLRLENEMLRSELSQGCNRCGPMVTGAHQ
ncbi:hypothetical protein HPB50_013731 [Hyalomma asiaticum]|uniref:Uncharacterized protein n=1 Tax=Hyalomma asiaticum TaxID=266040 RepID=A0ACB7RX77_HYAAI|nr:hypothetical protein HPB50_013731 [Hyalomma asiaticum]